MVGVKVKHVRISKEKFGSELRLADMDNQGGMAAVLNVDSISC
jgi:hypothetical protein